MSLNHLGTESITITVADSTWTEIGINSTPAATTAFNMTTALEETNDWVRYVECPEEVYNCKVQKLLFLVLAPILVSMSTIGNCLGLAVMTRKSLRKTATAVFISSLAVSDTIAVWTGLSRHFIRKLTTYDIRQYSEWTCWFQRFFLYMALDTSAWILAAISIERFIAVCMPHKHKILLKSTSRAWKVVIGIVIFQAIFNSNVFFNFGSQIVVNNNETITYACGFRSPSSREYLTVYHPWISMMNYCFLPFCAMLILNILIILRLTKLETAFASRNASTASSRSQINTNSMTRMLLCVTFYFMFITTPVFIFSIFQERLFENDSKIITPEEKGRVEVIDAVLTLMLYLNHSINFFLYCVSGKRFKRELLKLLKCRRRKDPHTVRSFINDTNSEAPFDKSTSAKNKFAEPTAITAL